MYSLNKKADDNSKSKFDPTKLDYLYNEEEVEVEPETKTVIEKLNNYLNRNNKKKVKKNLNKLLLNYYEDLKNDTADYLNEFNEDRNYLQFLIILIDYLNEIKKDIDKFWSVQSVYNKYKQDASIIIDLTYFINIIFLNKTDSRFDIYKLYNNYKKKIYRIPE